MILLVHFALLPVTRFGPENRRRVYRFAKVSCAIPGSAHIGVSSLPHPAPPGQYDAQRHTHLCLPGSTNNDLRRTDTCI